MKNNLGILEHTNLNEKKEVKNMEQDDLGNTGIGDKEAQKLGPATVTILGYTVKRETKEGKKMDSPLISFTCKHPNREESININKIKVIDGNQVKSVSMWVNMDEDDKIVKGSFLAQVLGFLKCSNLNDITNKTMEAVEESDSSKYLCLKAY